MPVQFDPKIHLAYAAPESRITMEELGKHGEGIAPVGITQVCLVELFQAASIHV